MTMSLRLASHLMLICFHAYCFVIRAAAGVMRTVVLVTDAALYVGLSVYTQEMQNGWTQRAAPTDITTSTEHSPSLEANYG
jgi:hypothetical protein